MSGLRCGCPDCNYPDCECKFDMGTNNICIKCSAEIHITDKTKNVSRNEAIRQAHDYNVKNNGHGY